MYRVVLIDDEAWTLAGLEKTFRWSEEGFEVVERFTGARAALAYLDREGADVIFTDIRMPGMTGLELLQHLRESACDAEVVIVSGFSDFGYAKQAIHWRALEYLVKPVSFEEADALLKRLGRRLEEKSRLTTLHHSQAEPDGAGVAEKEQETRVDNLAFSELLDYMRTHYAEPLQLRDLAVRCHISLSYCCLLFQKTMNKTFSEYLTELRMKAAAALLREGAMILSEVSEHVGFHDYYYFIRVFRKFYGITPSRYRKGRA